MGVRMNEENFEAWYKEYPNKKSKGAARTAYEKAEKKFDDPTEALRTLAHAIQAQKAFRKRQQAVGAFIPEWKMPATWLNQECWTDEIILEPEKAVEAALSPCSKPNCHNPTHGPRFAYCSHHEALEGSPILLEEVREKYRELSQLCTTTEEWRAKFKELAYIGLGGNIDQRRKG